MSRETPAYPARHDVRDGHLVVGGERVPVVVKRIPRDFRQPEGKTRAERSLRIARHLLAHGVDTPEPLGIEVTPEESVLVVRKVEGAVEVRAFFLRRNAPSLGALPLRASFEEVLTALARFARRMHDSGVFFRDFSDGNVLVTDGLGGFSSVFSRRGAPPPGGGGGAPASGSSISTAPGSGNRLSRPSRGSGTSPGPG